MSRMLRVITLRRGPVTVYGKAYRLVTITDLRFHLKMIPGQPRYRPAFPSAVVYIRQRYTN